MLLIGLCGTISTGKGTVADYVVYNNGDLKNLYKEVDEIISRLKVL